MMAKKSSFKKEKSFLKTPEYFGGKKALQEFISLNLHYPEDALEQKVEGVVTVEYEVNDEGNIEFAKILKGLCPSCNEEALRIVRLLQYSQAFNHGIRVKPKKKINICFKLSQKNIENTIQISFTVSEPKPKSVIKDNPLSENHNYSYSINYD